jgi:hypothetical protein
VCDYSATLTHALNHLRPFNLDVQTIVIVDTPPKFYAVISLSWSVDVVVKFSVPLAHRSMN